MQNGTARTRFSVKGLRVGVHIAGARRVAIVASLAARRLTCGHGTPGVFILGASLQVVVFIKEVEIAGRISRC